MSKRDRAVFHLSRLQRCARSVTCAAGIACALSPLVALAQTRWVPIGTRAHPHPGEVEGRAAADSERLSLSIILSLRNAAQLQRTNHALLSPGDPNFHHWMDRPRVIANFAPTAAQARRIAGYLATAGLQDVRIHPGRLVISATGSPAAIERAFRAHLVHVTRNQRDAIINTTDAQLPEALAGGIAAVLGLQTLDRMQPMSVPAARLHTFAGTGVQGLNPLQFPIAYDAASLQTASASTVGVITAGSMTQPLADLRQFETQNQLSPVTTTVVTAGQAGTDTTNTAEWDIDSQDILGMAGGQLANLVLYTGTSLNDADIAQAVDDAVNADIAPVVSVSLGECEAAAYADGAMAALDQLFQMAIAQGQTFAVATGDTGAKECGSPAGSASGASYPGSSPYVIAVGGTTLTTDGTGKYVSEIAWSDTGGSPSLVENQPTWQAGTVPGSLRGVPDIAFDGDPNSGTIIVVNGQMQQWGGTSLATPLFAGAWTRIQAANHARLGFPATWIYTHGRQGTTAYHDIVSGSNGGYSATAGWDYTTGFGSFDIAATALLTRSTVSVVASSQSISSGQSVTFTATVSGNAPTGTVQFYDNGVALGGPVTLVNGVATLTTTALSASGTAAITAVYSGDGNDAASTSPALQEVVQAAGTDVPLLPPWAGLLLAGGLIAVLGRSPALLPAQRSGS